MTVVVPAAVRLPAGRRGRMMADMMPGLVPGNIPGPVAVIFVNDYRTHRRRGRRGLFDDDRFAMVVFVAGDYRCSDNCGSHDTG